MTELLQIYCRSVSPWKTWESQSTFGEVCGKNVVALFDSPWIATQVLTTEPVVQLELVWLQSHMRFV